VLVATDIAARGIDVSLVSHVVNYDVPDTEEAYTHRIGRTGRAQHDGDAVTFVTRDDADMIRRIERVLGERIPVRRVDGFDYEVPAPRHSTPMRGASSAAAARTRVVVVAARPRARGTTDPALR
jgi:ATP-dependent RNA helicase RhlE